MKLALDLPEPETPDGREPRLLLAGVEETAVQLEPGERAHHVLEVRYRVEGAEDEPTIHLAQVLRPLGPARSARWAPRSLAATSRRTSSLA